MLSEKIFPITVMLVDDHKTMLWGLERLIGGENTGMKVVAKATNRADALAYAANLSPSVILLDIDLEGDCSLEFLPSMLLNGVSRALVFSGTRDRTMLDRAMHAGAKGIMRKDAPAEVVLRAIEKVHHGELWVDNETIARICGQFSKPSTVVRIDPEREKLASLTAKERRIIDAIIDGNGLTNKALAKHLFISEHTLRNYLVSIYKKLGVSNRLELFVYTIKCSSSDLI